MKPHDLKPAFAWKERRILIQDRIWYVPPRVQSEEPFQFPGWSDLQLFGNQQPVAIEYCSGNGVWIADKAELNPHLNWVAVERKFDRVRKIWSKIKNRQLSNLFIICGEAHHITKQYLPNNSVSEVYINFPDPWPKKKHAKNRLIQSSFAQELNRIMLPNSKFTFVTDDAPYSEWFINIMQKEKGFISAYKEPFYVTEFMNYGSSSFEELWRSKGKTIRYHQYISAGSA